MNLKDAFTTTLNLHWAGTPCEEEHWRIAQIWMGVLGAETHTHELRSDTLAKTAQAWLDMGLAPATINRRVAVLSKAIHTAADLVTSQPSIRLPRLKEPAPIDRSITEAQGAALMEGMLGLPAHAMVVMAPLTLFLLHTGARLGEAMAAQWEDIVDRRWTIRRSKNGTSRVVPINNDAAEALREIATDLPHGPLIFGSHATPSQIQHWWRRVREAAGLPHIRIHDLRHTCASNLVRKNVSLYTVQHLLGHKNIQTTQRYAHQNIEALEEAVQLL